MIDDSTNDPVYIDSPVDASIYDPVIILSILCLIGLPSLSQMLWVELY